jgi:hypothetical protein
MKSYKIKPGFKFQTSGNKLRDFCINLVENHWFDRVVISFIILNTVVLALKWYNMSDSISSVTEKLNYFFSAVFTLEAAIKIVALKGNYFKEGWNLFDFVIVIGTIIGIVVGQVSNVNVGP